MIKFGLIATGYKCADLLEKVMVPWIQRRNDVGDLVISLVHCCFIENHDLGLPSVSSDGSHEIMAKMRHSKQIDYYTFLDRPRTEQGARNVALNSVLPLGVDYVISLGMDEVFKLEEIDKLVDYVQKDPLITWYSIEYKNLIFTENQYTPATFPRVFKTDVSGKKLNQFYYDDDVIYQDLQGRPINYKNLSNKKIPSHLVFPLHYTWLNNERSKQKVKYQEKHFGHYAGCGFRWNNEKDCLEFNDKYYEITKQPIPEIFSI